MSSHHSKSIRCLDLVRADLHKELSGVADIHPPLAVLVNLQVVVAIWHTTFDRRMRDLTRISECYVAFRQVYRLANAWFYRLNKGKVESKA